MKCNSNGKKRVVLAFLLRQNPEKETKQGVFTMNREQTEQEVAQLADTWATAELQGDTAFLEKCLSDDFVGVGPLGFLLTKQEWLTRHQSGAMKYTTHTLD